MGGPDMGGLILYGACNGGPGIVRNVPNPARIIGGCSGGCRSEFSEVLDKFVTYRKVAKVTTPRKERKTRQESNSVKGLLPKRAIKCHRC